MDEVDFAIIKNRKAIELIEAKFSETKVSTSLLYYAEKLEVVRARQIVHKKDYRFVRGALEVIDCREALCHLKYFNPE
jgi:hypothetical protein